MDFMEVIFTLNNFLALISLIMIISGLAFMYSYIENSKNEVKKGYYKEAKIISLIVFGTLLAIYLILN